MARRLPTLEVPAFAAVPPGTPTAGEWVDTKGRAQRAADRQVDVEAFVATVSGRAAQWQAAIDTAAARGGGRVGTSIPSHVMEKGLLLKDRVTIDVPLGTTLDFSGMTAPVNNAAIYGEGTLTALPALGTPAVAKTATLTFSAAHGLVPGDEIMVYNPANNSFSPFRPEYRNGERARVKSVTSTTEVVLHANLYADHPTTVQMYKVNAIRTGLTGASLIGKRGASLLRIKFGSGLRFANLTLTGSDWQNLYLDKCYEVNISDLQIADSSPDVGTNYGIMVANCQTVKINKVTAATTRPGINMGGDNSVGCIPNRDIQISNVTTGRLSAHGNQEHVKISDSTIYGGYVVCGDYTSLTGSTVYSADTGYVVTMSEALGASHTLTGNTFVATRPHLASTGHVYIVWETQPLTRINGTCRITDNKLEMSDYGAIGGGVAVGLRVKGGALPGDNTLVVARNEITSAFAGGANMYAMWLSAPGSDGFRRVRVEDNICAGTIRLSDLAPERLRIAGNAVTRSSQRGIELVWPATQPWANCYVHVARNEVLYAWRAGIWLQGRATDTTLILEDNISLNNAMFVAGGGTAASDDVSIYALSFNTVVYRNNTIGDQKTTPSQFRADTVSTVTTLHEAENVILGGSTTQTRTSVTTRYFQGQGAGAPTFACADGSTYRNTTPGAASAFYVRQNGAWVAK